MSSYVVLSCGSTISRMKGVAASTSVSDTLRSARSRALSVRVSEAVEVGMQSPMEPGAPETSSELDTGSDILARSALAGRSENRHQAALRDVCSSSSMTGKAIPISRASPNIISITRESRPFGSTAGYAASPNANNALL
ncbi:unnamed protein product [Lampetra planeri]